MDYDIEEIMDDISFENNVSVDYTSIENILLSIQQFAQTGIGARNLKEFILIQLRNQVPCAARDNAVLIFQNEFEAFCQENFSEIIKSLNFSLCDFDAAKSIILKMNLSPLCDNQSPFFLLNFIIPEFTLIEDNGQFSIKLNSKNIPNLRISRDQLAKMRSKTVEIKNIEETQYMIKKLNRAKSFINNLRERQENLMSVMNAIVLHQWKYFESGDIATLIPMSLEDIANEVKLHISTVSRIANSKHIHTP